MKEHGQQVIAKSAERRLHSQTVFASEEESLFTGCRGNRIFQTSWISVKAREELLRL